MIEERIATQCKTTCCPQSVGETSTVLEVISSHVRLVNLARRRIHAYFDFQKLCVAELNLG